uniref:(northern house mosquito) hypothetical protein n=1 Tax=Culex pipiens TaxID=7175 RepID=A0A8D8IFW4_CULPI
MLDSVTGVLSLSKETEKFPPDIFASGLPEAGDHREESKQRAFHGSQPGCAFEAVNINSDIPGPWSIFSFGNENRTIRMAFHYTSESCIIIIVLIFPSFITMNSDCVGHN